MRTLLLSTLLACSQAAGAGADGPAETSPFRTDSAGEQRPWYRLKAGEFPPHGSEHRVAGALLEADFIHRTGQFRADGTGELVDFSLPPFGSVRYLNAEADLRDVPPGTHLVFFLYQDETGAFTRAAVVQDDFTTLARQGLTDRFDERKADGGILEVTRPNPPGKPSDPGRAGLVVDGRTRLWKGEGPAKLGDLAVGDELLVNLAGNLAPGRNRCADVWAGAEAQKRATEGQRKAHVAFLKARGLPARIDRAEGKTLTVTLMGDPDDLRALFKEDGIDPARWAAERRRVEIAVANDELRTYNPPVDRQGSTVLEFQEAPTDRHGCGGVRWVIEPSLLLEGFRKGRIIRLFPQGSWQVHDMPVGESLYSEVPNAPVEVEEPLQYPYRTDFANDDLPWYRLKPGEFPPRQSHHLVLGELVKADPARRSGRFRADRTGELVDWTMPPFGAVLYRGAEADLEDLPTGTRLAFFLHPDDGGAFTRATVIMDDFTRLAATRQSYRLDEARLDEGNLVLTRLLDFVDNEKGEKVRPPALGRGVFAVDEHTRVWKGGKPASPGDLVAGDELLVNQSGRTATGRGVCTEIWAGTDSRKVATDEQRARHDASLKERGLPAWVDAVDGKTLTVTFFSGGRKDFAALLDGDPWGKPVFAVPADDELRPTGAAADKLGFKGHSPEKAPAGAYGSSGVRWLLETAQPPGTYRRGQVLRVFKEGWPIKGDPAGDRPPAR